jgi:hypothetical protein
VTVASSDIDGKIVGHREQPRLRIFQRFIIQQVPAEPKEGFLGKIFRTPGVVRFSQKVAKDGKAKLLKIDQHPFIERHFTDSLLLFQGHGSGKGARRDGPLKHHLLESITGGRAFLCVRELKAFFNTALSSTGVI